MADVDVLQALWNGLDLVFTPSALGYMLLGVVLGLIVGILPGLGGPVGIAVLLPFTFDLGAVDAFALLIGTLSVVSTAGDLTAILFGVPGEAVAAALVVDGHPMAKQGQAGRAIGAALASSLLGALVGAAVLTATIPFLRPLVLTFASPELFMLTILGITFVASLSGGDTLKGLLSGGIGLLLSMIGLDSQTSTARYTLGQLSLWEGVGLVAVAIGLFGLPELVDLAVHGGSIGKDEDARTDAGRTITSDFRGVARGMREVIQHFWLTTRCSLIGAFIGILPGIGGSVSQWAAYGHAVQTSKDPEGFGKGRIEGVIGPGAANNSKEGGSLVPTLAFGVPGSVTMAVLLGAFILQGLTPGPSMLSDELDLTMSFIWFLVIANIIGFVLCLVILKPLVHTTRIRGGLLIAPLIVFMYLGAFAEKNAMIDVLLVLVFGLLGFVMVQLGYPRPPLLLGLVLGALAENYLFISVDRYGANWLTDSTVLIIAAVTVLALLYPQFTRWRRSRRSATRDEEVSL